jgi:hypothetical protein
MEPSRQKAVAAAEARELEKQLAATEKAATEKAAAEKAAAEKAAVEKAAAEKAAAEKAAAEQKRKARAERAKYFSALRTEVHAVEAAVGRVQDDEADIDADAEVNSILYPSVPRLDPAAELALSKARVGRLLSSLHVDSHVAELGTVLDWLDGAADHSGEHEKVYRAQEDEGVQLEALLRESAEVALKQGLDKRDELTSRRLGGFGEQLSSHAALQRAREAKREAKQQRQGYETAARDGAAAAEAAVEAAAAADAAAASAAQLELMGGLLRDRDLLQAELVRLELRSRDGHARGEAGPPATALHELGEDSSERGAKIRQLVGEQAAQLEAERSRIAQLETSLTLVHQQQRALRHARECHARRRPLLQAEVAEYARLRGEETARVEAALEAARGQQARRRLEESQRLAEERESELCISRREIERREKLAA